MLCKYPWNSKFVNFVCCAIPWVFCIYDLPKALYPVDQRIMINIVFYITSHLVGNRAFFLHDGCRTASAVPALLSFPMTLLDRSQRMCMKEPVLT